MKHTACAVLVSLAVGTVASGEAKAQTNAETLTLYASEGQGGDKRVISGNETDLKTKSADNFAYSLKAEGRWEVCMDPGFRAGCRIVEGVIADLGRDGGAISSARLVGGSVQAGNASAGPEAVQSAIEQAFAYSTVYSNYIKPRFVINAVEGKASGQWIATQSEEELNDIYYNYGTYGLTSGSFEGEFAGNVFTGDYVQEFWNDGLLGACEAKKRGTFYHGRLVIEFSADRTTFQAKMARCESDPADAYFEWSGTLTGRTAQVTTALGANAVAASGDGSTTGQPGRRTAVDRIAEDAGDEAERAVSDEVRRKVRKGIGSILKGD